MAMLGLSFAEAAAMASLHPAQFLSLDDLGAAPDRRASLVLLDDKLNVLTTWIDGAAVNTTPHSRDPRPGRGAGDPGVTRTRNRPLRRRLLYPVELRGRCLRQ